MPPTASIKIRKPGAAERAVRRQHGRKDRGFSVSVRCRSSWRSLYGTMARKNTRQSRRARPPAKRAPQGARRACARPRRQGRRRQGRARSRPTTRPPPARCRNGQRREIEEAFRRFQAANPEPKGELEHVNPFTLLVAVVLSAQATDAGVNKATPALFAAADTPEKMAALGEERVRELIKTIGLFRTKAKNVVALSQQLVDAAWRQGAAHARGAGGAARRRPQDRQCRAQRRLRRADDRGRHPHLPRRQPHRARDRQDAVRGRDEARRVVPRPIQAPCPSLADPARPLRLRGAPPAVREMPDRRPVQMAGQRPSLQAPLVGAAARRSARGDPPRWRHDRRSITIRRDSEEWSAC